MNGFNSADIVGGNYDNKYELPIGGYFKRCPNGHSIYTINGDWDCGLCNSEEDNISQCIACHEWYDNDQITNGYCPNCLNWETDQDNSDNEQPDQQPYDTDEYE